jgi:hypothetical protein
MILHTVDPRSGMAMRAVEQYFAELNRQVPGTLTDAIALYERAGYRRIARYNDNPHSQVWLEKSLTIQPVWGTRVGS